MIGEILGVKLVNFVIDKTGEVVQGTKLFLASDDIECFGRSCSEVYIGAGSPLEDKLANYLRLPKTLVGMKCDYAYSKDSKGKAKLQQFDIIAESGKDDGVKKAS